MKKRFAWLIGLLIPVVVTALFGATAVGVMAAEYAFNAKNFVESTDGNYLLYPITGGTNTALVKWNQAPADTSESHTLSSTIAGKDGITYTVKGIAEAGFRGCDFTSITLPETIEDIKAEAFASCQQLTSILLPSKIDHIAPSTFRDCRALEHVYYNDGSGNSTTRNSKITSIGDHAFISCVNLISFPCPSSVTSIGESAFQGCTRMRSFFLPNRNGGNTNKVTLGKYAFSDCTAMTMCYFDLNLETVGEFVFAECEKLTLYYTGNEIPTPSNHANFDLNWRKSHIATNRTDEVKDYVPIILETGQLIGSDDHQGLYWTIETSNIMLDQWTTGTKDAQKTLQSSPGTYARIFKFETPDGDTYDYDFSEGRFTVPETLPDSSGTQRTVKVIAPDAFSYNQDLKEVIFSANLVQICNHAFFRCENIESLDFSRCTKLLEVSYQIFQDNANSTPANEKLETLILPNCLKYIGAYSFYNFRAVTDFSLQTNPAAISQTVFIASHAFSYLGYNCGSEGTVELVLTSQLREGDTDNFKPANCTNSDPHSSFANWQSPIQQAAFEFANCIKTIDVWNQNLPGGTKPRWSVAKEGFRCCESLIRFRSNTRLAYIGSACFEGCVNIRELFLYSDYAKANVGNGYVAWGNPDGNGNGGPIFGTSTQVTYPGNVKKDVSYPNAVIYVNGTADNLQVNNKVGTKGECWNRDVSKTYLDPFGSTIGEMALHPTDIPTYYGVSVNTSGNFISWTGVKYLDLSDNSLDDTTDFSTDTVGLLCKDSHYTPTRCYVNSDREVVDLTLNATVSANVLEIGQSAFAAMAEGPIPGMTIYLPPNVTTIRERAFFRLDSGKSNGNGVEVVTYKSGGDPVAIEGKTNYCVLPSSLATIEKLAFFNNRFETIDIKGSLDFSGMSAFSVFPGAVSNSTIAELDVGGSTFTEGDSGGLYYSAVAAKKTLIYQPAAGTGSLAVDADTVAIGPRACANTMHSSIEIPDTVTTIYGGAFSRNLSLASFTTGTGVKYIGSPYDSDLLSDVPFDWKERGSSTGQTSHQARSDFSSSYGAFRGCTALATFDFTKMTALEKIGFCAFDGCGALSNMCGTAKYSYYKWNSGMTALEEVETNTSAGVLDLRASTGLRSIGRNSFDSCSGINYVMLPNTTSLYVGTDPDVTTDSQQGNDRTWEKSPFNNTGAKILTGEKAAKIDAGSGSRDTSRYPNYAFKGVGATYYPFSSTSDLLSGDTTALKYWAQLGEVVNNCFLLCENKDQATAWANKSASEKEALIADVLG